MAKKKTTDPSALKMRAAVIESRDRGSDKWEPIGYYAEGSEQFREDNLVWVCLRLKRNNFCTDFRYRYGTLTFDDDGSKSVIY